MGAPRQYLTKTNLGAVKRMKHFGAKCGSEDKGGEDLRPAEDWPESGEIMIEGVDASYEEDRYKADGEGRSLVLKGIQMKIQAGEKVAIMGRTGSGKSSLILVLLRLLDPTSETAGNITIDDTPLWRIHRDTLRQRRHGVPHRGRGLQDRTRSLLQKHHINNEYRSALEQVGLWNIIRDTRGLHAETTKDVFSQGQKQLFSLAIAVIRAQLRQKHGSRGGILLLDEVTGSVDRDLQQTRMKFIQLVFTGYTVVAVTHSLESIVLRSLTWYSPWVIVRLSRRAPHIPFLKKTHAYPADKSAQNAHSTESSGRNVHCLARSGQVQLFPFQIRIDIKMCFNSPHEVARRNRSEINETKSSQSRPLTHPLSTRKSPTT